VVVTGQVDRVRAGAYRDMVISGVEQVRDLWGRDRVVLPIRLHLPRSAAQWSQATGHPVVERGYAGTTVRRPGQEPVVVIHPDAWDALTPQGRAAVVTHEITHLAMGSSGSAPWWLAEGLAEYTAHRASDADPARIAGSALPRLLADPPSGWPQAAASTSAWQGYASAWLACVFLAGEVGEQALLEAHTRTHAGSSWQDVCRASLGRPASQLHRQWITWLQSVDRQSA